MNILVSALPAGDETADTMGKTTGIQPWLCCGKSIVWCRYVLRSSVGFPPQESLREIREGKVYNRLGEEVTANFTKGAAETLKLAKFFGCQAAVLKERSPSCGCGVIYDGSFSGKKIPGDGDYGSAAEASRHTGNRRIEN